MMYGGQTGLTCTLAKAFHCDVFVLPTGNGPQLALVSVGHPIRATHLLRIKNGNRLGSQLVNSMPAYY